MNEELMRHKWDRLLWLAFGTLVLYKFGSTLTDIIIHIIDKPSPVLL